MASAAQAYEKSVYSISPPRTIQGMIELKMYEKKLKQKALARLIFHFNAAISAY